jgi:hypothetical protein
VGVDAFVLNACHSYEQGQALVEAGAMAGIVTLREINVDKATSVGITVARLLNEGFSLAATMSLVSEYEQIGHHYIVVGDASTSVVRNESGTPYTVTISDSENDEIEMSLFGYPRLDSPLGCFFTPFVSGEEQCYLNSGHLGTYRLTKDELEGFLSKQNVPVIEDTDLFWGLEIFNTD